MKLPFRPESISKLRERYPAAIAETQDVEAVRHGFAAPASGRRTHVFDTSTGLRLIVSIDLDGTGRRYLHVSGSVEPGTSLGRRLYAIASSVGPVEASDGLRNLVEQTYRRISCDPDPLPFEGFSAGKGVPHWCRPVGPQPAERRAAP